MQKSLFMIMTLMMSVVAMAQNKVTGTVIGGDDQLPIVQATVQLLKSDSTYVAGTVSNSKGSFSMSLPSDGKYIIKVSSIGYVTQCKNVTAAGKDVALGKMTLKQDALVLKDVEVTGHAVKVTLKKDTFIYNADAFRTPEGSVLEELVKRLPGAQIDDDGKITINGKEVKKILIDGKEFMTGDTKTAMKNIPTSIVQKVKAYDKKSDLSRVTGIDDGEEETVLDFGVKPGMNHGMFSNIDLSIGTKSRYSERVMGAYFNDDFRLMAFGSGNNTNDMGFPGGGGRGNFGRGRSGLNTSKMGALNMNYEKKDKLIVDASVNWNHNNGDAKTISSTENFVSTAASFSNSISQSYTRSDSWNGRGRLEWMPDTMTNIMFRPSFSISKSDDRSWSQSASFSEDPYESVDNPLEDEDMKKLEEQGLIVNSNDRRSLTYSKSMNLNGTLQLNRKLSSNGRNVTLRLEGGYSDGDGNSLSMNDVHLYQMLTAAGADSTYQTNRYNLTPTKNWNYSAKLAYSEPLWKQIYLQFSYQFKYSYSKSDRSTFDFSNLGEGYFDNVPLAYRGWGSFLNLLDNPLESYLDESLSRFSEYKNYTHSIEVMLRVNRNKYRLNVGMLVQPQRSNYVQDYQGISVDTMRTVTNVAPTLDFRYKFNDRSNLRVNYRASSSQPSISQLLDITDDSDPLNISKGNPGLKPSFTQRFRLFYNTYLQKHQQAIMTFANFSTTSNSISNMVTYDETTGGRTTQPQNINGNWDAQAALMFNTALDTLGYWNINTFTDATYNNYVSYLSLDNMSSSVKNRTRSLQLSERLEGSFRNDWLEVAVDGSFSYMHSRNKMQPNSNLDTWQFAYGLTLGVTAPWGTSLSTDIHENSRRGYADASMNTNELVWNAQVSQSFLKGKPLTVSLQFYDILHNQSNFSRNISATQRNDVQYNAINSYIMLHAVYRLNLFGSGGDKGPQGPRGGMGPGPRGGRGGGGFGRPR